MNGVRSSPLEPHSKSASAATRGPLLDTERGSAKEAAAESVG